MISADWMNVALFLAPLAASSRLATLFSLSRPRSRAAADDRRFIILMIIMLVVDSFPIMERTRRGF
jgi:hypothetical protein